VPLFQSFSSIKELYCYYYYSYFSHKNEELRTLLLLVLLPFGRSLISSKMLYWFWSSCFIPKWKRRNNRSKWTLLHDTLDIWMKINIDRDLPMKGFARALVWLEKKNRIHYFLSHKTINFTCIVYVFITELNIISVYTHKILFVKDNNYKLLFYSPSTCRQNKSESGIFSKRGPVHGSHGEPKISIFQFGLVFKISA